MSCESLVERDTRAETEKAKNSGGASRVSSAPCRANRYAVARAMERALWWLVRGVCGPNVTMSAPAAPGARGGLCAVAVAVALTQGAQSSAVARSAS